MIVWLIGLAGAGKTTIGRQLYQEWKKLSPNTVIIDGDDFRKIMGDDLGHSQVDREKNGWRICRLCKHLDDQSINVVVCILSNFPEQQQWNREHYQDYFEVFVDASIKTLEQRDQKGLYSGAKVGRVKGVVGVDQVFYPPSSPDIVIDSNSSNLKLEKVVDEMLSEIGKKLDND